MSLRSVCGSVYLFVFCENTRVLFVSLMSPCTRRTDRHTQSVQGHSVTHRNSHRDSLPPPPLPICPSIRKPRFPAFFLQRQITRLGVTLSVSVCLTLSLSLCLSVSIHPQAAVSIILLQEWDNEALSYLVCLRLSHPVSVSLSVCLHPSAGRGFQHSSSRVG